MWATRGGWPRRAREVGDAVGQDVGTGLPGHHRRRRHDPLVGVERPQVDVGVEPRVELHAAERDAPLAQVVDRGDDRAGRVVARLGAVPVGGAVVGPVRRPGSEGVGPAARSHGAGPLEQQRGPTRRGTPAARRRRGPAARSRSRRRPVPGRRATRSGRCRRSARWPARGRSRSARRGSCGRRGRRAAGASRSAAGGEGGRSRRGRRRPGWASRTRSAGRRGPGSLPARRRPAARRA